MIRDFQRQGHLVAMTGDGTNDAPALAQADVAVAMNSGTQAAKEAGNMVDLDSSPTKLIDIVRIGKQLLMTRGSLTTFSIANDLAKYFAIIPALFSGVISGTGRPEYYASGKCIQRHFFSNHIQRPDYSCVNSSGLKGCKIQGSPGRKIIVQKPAGLWAWGIAAPFIAIKLIDMIITGIGLV